VNRFKLSCFNATGCGFGYACCGIKLIYYKHGSLAPRLLGQCSPGNPASFPLPDTILYRLWSATYWPISTHPFPLLSIDFPCSSLSLPSNSYIAGCFRLVAQSAATCSRWFLARGFSTLKMDGIRSSETSVYTISTRRHISEDGILHLAIVYNFYPQFLFEDWERLQ
jgi:hypothetical protein